ncbi:hypothetical protein SAMN05661096_03926 [Marivirga sericea]|uniref:Uncharacterized protein n=1 Tax=Marivirga sericea TaxID=1028 RepID=A0A1X7LEZ7_9BACT|nr:hypothetical protein [Marivirga sericea]SMG52446.1 hypothetical protein SAMN05661096_03926 [Marivirga sericea]
MKYLYLIPIICLLIISSGSGPKKVGFSGELLLEIDDKKYTYDAMTRSGSRLSFQKKGVSIYIVNPEGKGTIAQITLLSTKIYESKSHTYELGAEDAQPQSIQDLYNKDASKKKDILSFKFRRIDKMEEEEYIRLSKGTVDLEYDDEAPYLKITFQGQDKNGTSLSGSLELDDPYVIDRRD